MEFFENCKPPKCHPWKLSKKRIKRQRWSETLRQFNLVATTGKISGKEIPDREDLVVFQELKMNKPILVAFLLLATMILVLARPPVYYPNGYPADDDYENNYHHKSGNEQGGQDGYNSYNPNFSKDLYKGPRGGQYGKKPGYQQGGYPPHPNNEVKGSCPGFLIKYRIYCAKYL